MNTDKERIDFIELAIASGDCVKIEKNSLIGNQPGAEDNPVQIFTLKAQHQYGKTVREVIDIAMEFGSGKRNWRKENWPKKFEFVTGSGVEPKKYTFRSAMLDLPMDIWEVYRSYCGDSDFHGTPEEFLDKIGLPSSLSAKTNPEEKEFIKVIYELWRSKQ